MWKLNGREIYAPDGKKVKLQIQSKDHLAVDGSNSRDYIGSEKKVISCDYKSISQTDYQTLSDLRAQQISIGLAVNLVIHQDGFDFVGNVIIELPEIDFNLPNHYKYRSITVTFIEQ